MPIYKTQYLSGLLKGKFKPIYWHEFRELYKRATNLEHKNLLFLAFITGLRPIEVSRLKKENITFEGNYIIIEIETAKRGVVRRIFVPVANDIARNFKTYVKENLVFPKEFVFPTFVKKRNLRDKFRYMNKLHLIGRSNETGTFEPFSFYTFRHNILTLLAEYGADFVDLQIYKGSRLSKTLYGSAVYYIHHSSERMKKIAKILRKIMK